MAARDTIVSAANPLIQRTRELLRPEGRRARGEFLAEGVRLIADAVAMGARPSLLFVDVETPREQPRVQALLSAVDPGLVISVGGRALAAISDARTPQGVVAVFALDRARSPTRFGPHSLLLDGVQDPGNTGSAIRSAAASGVVERVVVRGGADPFGPKAVRSAAAALFAIPVERSGPQEIGGWRDGRRLLIADAADGQRYDLVDWSVATVLAVGSEASGISDDVRRDADGAVHIPLGIDVESLNAAMAASIILFEAARQLGFRSSQLQKA